MLRRYLPDWAKTEGFEFFLELISAAALGFVAVERWL